MTRMAISCAEGSGRAARSSGTVLSAIARAVHFLFAAVLELVSGSVRRVLNLHTLHDSQDQGKSLTWLVVGVRRYCDDLRPVGTQSQSVMVERAT